jgi:hypothetical protein
VTELRVKHINGEQAVPLGAKPDPIVHQYLDQNGDPVDMSVGTWVGQGRAEQLFIEDPQPANLGDGSVVIDDVEATATYVWHTADFAQVGKFRIIIWVGNGTLRYGSTVYEWDVADAPGAPPSV